MKFSNIYFLLIFLSVFALCKCSSANTDCKSTKKSDEFMELTGSVKKIENDFIKFSMTAKRLKVKDGEYLPNSENFRVVVFDADNTVIFNSDYEKNFFQAIMDVEPKLTGDEKEYEYIWNVKNNFSKKVPPGNYTAILSIPSLPDSYFLTVNFGIEN